LAGKINHKDTKAQKRKNKSLSFSVLVPCPLGDASRQWQARACAKKRHIQPSEEITKQIIDVAVPVTAKQTKH
jgi:hypothetical protein